MWFQHLQTVQDNRKRGASKAAKTRRERGLNKKTENHNTEASYFIVSVPLKCQIPLGLTHFRLEVYVFQLLLVLMACE